MRRWLTRRWTRRDERGQSALEFVFVLPFVFIVIFLVAEATSILKTWMLLENASREGARAAAVGKTDAQACDVMRTRAGNILPGGSGCGSGVSLARNTSNPQDSFATASISYTYTFKTPLLALVEFVSNDTISNSVTMNARTVMRIE
jgi:Flp pilus assembly protein TadG